MEKTTLNLTHGHNGDICHKSSLDSLLDFFSKAGSASPNNKSYYGATVPVVDLFEKAWEEDKYKSMQLAMWLRDCRGGAANRSGFRDILTWLGENEPDWIKANIHLVTEVGRWDDLIALFGTPCEDNAISVWADGIIAKNGLACKWTPREKSNPEVFKKLRKHLKCSPSQFRKYIAENTKVVESAMCNNEWDSINYNHVPSVAMARLNNTFSRNDTNRFMDWSKSLSDKDSGNKVNASVLFPHDCIRTLKAELGASFISENRYANVDTVFNDSLIANAQFDALPNFMEGNDLRILPICDFSGSMCSPISESNSIELIDVSLGMGLYCSDRLGKENPFYRKFIPFSGDATLVSWEYETFSVAAQKYNDGFCGSTNIRSALDMILNSAKLFNATTEQMPNCLLILSDMQWDSQMDGDDTAVELGMKDWEKNGYKRPKIVYWNLNRYDGYPCEFDHPEVAMVSGYSPSLLKAICKGDDFSPLGIMNRTIAKYEVVRPE